MSRTIVIVLAAVCLATVVVPPASAVTTEPSEPGELPGYPDMTFQCIAIDWTVFPPVYWYSCG